MRRAKSLDGTVFLCFAVAGDPRHDLFALDKLCIVARWFKVGVPGCLLEMYRLLSFGR